MIRLALPCLLAGALAGVDGPVVTVHGLAREGGLLRVEVRAQTTGRGPGRLSCSLRPVDSPADQAPLSAASAELADLSRLADGAILVMPIPSPCPSRLWVTASVARPDAGTISTTVVVRTPAAALHAVAAAVDVLRLADERDPLPWLWAEQAADLATGSATAGAVAAMEGLTRRLTDWSTGTRPPVPGPGLSSLAIRDPVDASVQPYYLHLPPGDGPFPIVLLLPAATPATGKAGWAPPAPATLAAAAAAGVAVIVCYPAGDRAWQGAAARRIRPTLADALARAPLDRNRGAVVAATPPPGAPFPVHSPGSLDDPAWWRALPGPAQADSPVPATDLSTVLTAPFTVVVGTAEHRAARTANRRLAEAFRDAYAAHAHAVPPQVDDDVDPASLTGRNLVLIGNPRSNRILASLALELPCTWDHRLVQGPGGAGMLRAAGGGIACLGRLAGGHLALVLDGRPPAWGDGLPLAGQTSPLWLPTPQR